MCKSAVQIYTPEIDVTYWVSQGKFEKNNCCSKLFFNKGRGLFMHVPSQWEMMLHCNVVPHCLGAWTKWSQQVRWLDTEIDMSSFWLLSLWSVMKISSEWHFVSVDSRNVMLLLTSNVWYDSLIWNYGGFFTPQPSSRSGRTGGRLGGRLPNLRNPYLCNLLMDFLRLKFFGIV